MLFSRGFSATAVTAATITDRRTIPAVRLRTTQAIRLHTTTGLRITQATRLLIMHCAIALTHEAITLHDAMWVTLLHITEATMRGGAFTRTQIAITTGDPGANCPLHVCF